MKYNKLVKDNIPEIIKKDNKTPIIPIANYPKYKIKLKEKLLEGVREFIDSSNKEELIDILEVIDAICYTEKIDKSELIHLKQQKADKKGKFKDKIILERIE